MFYSVFSARMQCLAIILSGYPYDIVFRSSRDNSAADLLGRLPVRNCDDIDEVENCVCYTVVNDLPVTSETIAECTSKNLLLCKVYEFRIKRDLEFYA